METKTLEPKQTSKKNIQLVNGCFTPSEASDIINGLIDEKINFHKIQKLQIWEGNHVCKTKPLDDRISQLIEEKRTAKEFISEMRASGKKLKINGILEISIND